MPKKNKKKKGMPEAEAADRPKDSTTSPVEPVKADDTASTDTQPKDATPTTTPSTGGPTVVKKEVKRGLKPTHLWIIILVAGLLLIGGATWAGMQIFGPQSPSVVHPATNTKTTAFYRKLDGMPVEEDKVNPNLYAVMIENLTDSRPPSGLDKAPVVYEALAEGGITRFMAIFPITVKVDEIGPVRSSRRYYIDWAEEYNKPLYIHAGGAPNALSYLKSSANVIDFNQFYHAGNFWRDKTRFAPHNLYTSSDKLFLGLKQVAPDNVPDYSSWTFKDPAALSQRQAPTASQIVIDYSSFNYQVTYKYHPELNRYFRFQGDTQHVTRDGQAIWATNVIVMKVQTGLLAGDSKRLDMKNIGTGEATVFRDGQVIQGTWKKDSGQARTEFLDADGQPIPLDRGSTWISVIPTDRDVSYSAPQAETTN